MSYASVGSAAGKIEYQVLTYSIQGRANFILATCLCLAGRNFLEWLIEPSASEVLGSSSEVMEKEPAGCVLRCRGADRLRLHKHQPKDVPPRRRLTSVAPKYSRRDSSPKEEKKENRSKAGHTCPMPMMMLRRTSELHEEHGGTASDLKQLFQQTSRSYIARLGATWHLPVAFEPFQGTTTIPDRLHTLNIFLDDALHRCWYCLGRPGACRSIVRSTVRRIDLDPAWQHLDCSIGFQWEPHQSQLGIAQGRMDRNTDSIWCQWPDDH